MDVPIACSLTVAGARAQLDEWRALCQTPATDTVPTIVAAERRSPTELRLRLNDDLTGVTELVRLARREQACCPFFDFRLAITAEAVTLTIEVPEEAAAVLDDLAQAEDGPTETQSSVRSTAFFHPA